MHMIDIAGTVIGYLSIIVAVAVAIVAVVAAQVTNR